MAFFSEAEISKIRLLELATPPEGNPPEGSIWFYYDPVAGFQIKTSDGSVVNVDANVSVATLNDVGNVDTAGATTGAVLVFNGTNWVDLPVGADGQVVTADSGQVAGVSFQTPSSASGVDNDAQVLLWMGI